MHACAVCRPSMRLRELCYDRSIPTPGRLERMLLQSIAIGGKNQPRMQSPMRCTDPKYVRCEIASDATYAVWLKLRLRLMRPLTLGQRSLGCLEPLGCCGALRSCVLVDMTTQPAPHPLSGDNTSNDDVARRLTGVRGGRGCGAGVLGLSKSCIFGQPQLQSPAASLTHGAWLTSHVRVYVTLCSTL